MTWSQHGGGSSVTQIASGTLAARPAASGGNANTYYYTTDTNILYYSNGSIWTAITTSTTQIASGTLAARPAASAGNANTYYYETDNNVLDYSNGSAWTTVTSPGGVQSITAGTNMTNSGTATNPVLNAAEAAVTIPSGFIVESYPRSPGVSTATLAALTSGQVSAWAATLIAGQIFSKIAFEIGSTAAVTPAHAWYAIYDSNFNAVAATIDNGAGAIAATQLLSLAIGFVYSGGAWQAASQWTVPTSGLYYVGMMASAATVPTLTGSATNANLIGQIPALAVQDTAHTGLTTPNTSPSPITNSTTATGAPYFCLG